MSGARVRELATARFRLYDSGIMYLRTLPRRQALAAVCGILLVSAMSVSAVGADLARPLKVMSFNGPTVRNWWPRPSAFSPPIFSACRKC